MQRKTKHFFEPVSLFYLRLAKENSLSISFLLGTELDENNIVRLGCTVTIPITVHHAINFAFQMGKMSTNKNTFVSFQ